MSKRRDKITPTLQGAFMLQKACLERTSLPSNTLEARALYLRELTLSASKLHTIVGHDNGAYGCFWSLHKSHHDVCLSTSDRHFAWLPSPNNVDPRSVNPD